MAPDPQSYGHVDFPAPCPQENAPKEIEYAAVLRQHPILSNAQVALKEELLERKRDLDERLREKGFALKKATKKREDAGVKLYGLQKTLATLQMSRTSANEHLAATSLGHLKVDEELAQYQTQHKAKSCELGFLREKLEKSKQELSSLGEALRQIELHNEKVKDEIAVSRRVTYATEEDIVRAEKEKKDQDYLLVHLEQEIKQHLDKKILIQAKMTAQRKETQVARDALTEAEIEMESIKSEKKQILMQWKSSLIVLARCDEALQGLHDAIDKQKEQEVAIQGEKHSLKKAIRQEHSKVEQKVAALSSIDNHLRVTQRKIQQVVAKRLKFLEEYTNLLVSVQDMESKVQKIMKESMVIEAGKQALNHRKACGGVDPEETANIKIIADIRRQIREAHRYTNGLNGRLDAMQGEKQLLQKDLDELQQIISQMAANQEHLRLKLKEVAFKKTSYLLNTALQQRMVKRYCEFKVGKWKVKVKLMLETELDDCLRKCVALYELAQAFHRDMPELQPKLDCVCLQLNLAVKLGQ